MFVIVGDEVGIRSLDQGYFGGGSLGVASKV